MAVAIADRIVVLELKIKQNATQALQQAFVENYAAPFQTWSLPVILYGMQFDPHLLTIQDFRQWDLGIYNPTTARWERAPFPLPLSELASLPLAERKAYTEATDLCGWIQPCPPDIGHIDRSNPND